MRFARRIGAERSLFQPLVNKSGDASPHLVSEHRARHNPQRYHRLSRARRRYYASRPPNVTPTDSREEPNIIASLTNVRTTSTSMGDNGPKYECSGLLAVKQTDKGELVTCQTRLVDYASEISKNGRHVVTSA
jgi:hypothetical protein